MLHPRTKGVGEGEGGPEAGAAGGMIRVRAVHAVSVVFWQTLCFGGLEFEVAARLVAVGGGGDGRVVVSTSSWDRLHVKPAGAGVGGTPRGRGSTCESWDNRPTLTYQNHFSPVAWDMQCKQFKNTQTGAYTR